MPLAPTTLQSLAATPDLLEAAFRLVPRERWTWPPPSWEGVPGERFAPLGQICHVRDIEIAGYQVRINRMLYEDEPALVSLDSYNLAADRHYDDADPEEVLASFRDARAATLKLLDGLTEEQLQRRGTFGEYGPLTLRSLVHYLASHDAQHLACLEWLLGQIHALSPL